MAGYFELEVMERSGEACEALNVLCRFIVTKVDKPDWVATKFDKILGHSTADTLVVPDADQFNLLRDAFRALDTVHLPTLAAAAAGGPPLVRLICYRNGRAEEHTISDDELIVEYFNPRQDSDGFMFHHTDSAVRLTHRSTGTATASDGARSRHRNLAQAREMLNAKLADNPTALLLSGQSIRALQQSHDLASRR